MQLVVTLVTSPETPSLDNYIIGLASSCISRATTCRVLSEHVAVEYLFEGHPDEIHTFDSLLRQHLRHYPIDIFVQSNLKRRKKLFLADMDSTIIQQECIDELADFAGIKDQVSDITEKAMRGELSFIPALEERVLLLKGLPLSTIQKVIEKHLTFSSGARELIATLRYFGTYTCLISGGFTVFTNPIAQTLGFHENRANQLGIENLHLNGKVQPPIIDKTAKLLTLKELRNQLKLDQEDTMAVGDGANDLDMLLEAGTGVAYHAKPKVSAAARYKIEFSDLKALLYMQGYSDSDIIFN